jgi:hypothetical protein
MLDHSCQVGRRPLAERGHDLYSTPEVAVKALLRVWTPPVGKVWEPCSGLNPIVRILRAHGHDVMPSDLVDYGVDPTARYGVDFLTTTTAPPGVSCIVTNPPFKLIEQFVAHALELVPCTVMLCRLAFLESERRCYLLDDAGLRRVFVFRKRLPMMHDAFWTGKKANSGMAFAWMIWTRGYRGPVLLRRISWEDNRDAKVRP